MGGGGEAGEGMDVGFCIGCLSGEVCDGGGDGEEVEVGGV